MPFDFKAYDAKCAVMDPDALQREWEHYTRLISGAATSTAVSGVAVPFTLGVSTIGVAMAAPAIHNARKKREIIERHLQRHGRIHRTRKRDVLGAGAISGTIGLVTLGVAPIGAEAISNSAAEHGMAYVVENELMVKAGTHFALDAAAVGVEEAHNHNKKDKEAWKAYAKAVKEGKNPPLPGSHVQIPLPPSVQAANFSAVPTISTEQRPQVVNPIVVPAINLQSSTQAIKAIDVPTISVETPAEQKSPVGYVPTTKPPPPDLAALQASKPVQRRSSTSTLPKCTANWTSDSPHLMSDYYGMVGTTTAISAPMPAGQSYQVQVSDSLSDKPHPVATEGSIVSEPFEEKPALSCRRLSVEAVEEPPKDLRRHSSSIDLGTQQMPWVAPPPPYRALPDVEEIQQLHVPTQRPRGTSVVSSDNRPGYSTPLPPPTPRSPPHRASTPNAYTPNYVYTPSLSHLSSISYQAGPDQKTYFPSPRSCIPRYNPMDYA